jgi:hypothetical protein
MWVNMGGQTVGFKSLFRGKDNKNIPPFLMSSEGVF